MKVSEIFYSIEGEGMEIGKPEVFVRLSGCNLRCVWCDTKYALKKGKLMKVESIVSEIRKYPCLNVSITGGEPLLQSNELFDFVKKLEEGGYWTQLNTNGTLFDEGIFKLVDLISMDCKCPSSMMKSDTEVLKRVEKLFDQKTQFKFVISDEKDFEYAKKILLEIDPQNAVFQPQWGNKKFTGKLVELVKADGLKARIILQQHKMIWGQKKGV